jgi:DNA-binding transcriptional ArsR family regulator
VATHPDRDLVLKALRNPMSRKVLFVLSEKPEGATIRELSTRMKEPSRRVRHYVEVLVEDGLVVVKDERRSRGTIERTFKAEQIPLVVTEELTGSLNSPDEKLMLLDILRLSFDSLTGAIGAGTFLERPGWCAVRNWREVDSQGWDELAEIHLRATREVIAVVDAAAERLAEGEAEVIEALPWPE